MRNPITKYALINSLAAAAYITIVAFIMSNINRIVPPDIDDGGPRSILPAITFLTLFVISAAVMGLTIFGRPVMWYLDGKKAEAVKLALYTVGFLAILGIIFFVCLILRTQAGLT